MRPPLAFFTPTMKASKIPEREALTCPPPKRDCEPVSIFCRIRPIDEEKDNWFISPLNLRTIKLTPPPDSFAFRNGSAKEQCYSFSKVFDDSSTQKSVFDVVAHPLIKDLIDGKNGLLFVYGITGSGKTYTMQGTRRQPGILRRSIRTLFQNIGQYQTTKYVFKPDKMNGFDIQSEADAMLDKQRIEGLGRRQLRNRRFPVPREDTSSQNSTNSCASSCSPIAGVDPDSGYAVFITYIEIYKNYVYDLLEELSETNMTRELQSKILREDSKHNMYVHGCTEVEVKTAEEAFEVLSKGQKRRKVAQTKLNVESSRSHSIFTIRLVQAPHDELGERLLSDKDSMVVSQLSLVDLAGSERNDRSDAKGQHVKEAGTINNSLMLLRQCIQNLRDNQAGQRKVISYRNSKLTYYFKNYFEGQGLVKMIVCVNPQSENYDETLPVMQFAELASEIEIQLLPVSARPANPGLAPGRRKANQVFKEVKKRLEDDLHNCEELPVITVSSIDIPKYSIGPDFPEISGPVNRMELLSLNKQLKDFLETRVETEKKFKQSLQEQALKLRKDAANIQNDVICQSQAAASYKTLYEDCMKNLKKMETHLLNAKSTNDSIRKRFSDYNGLMDEYKQACEERDMAKNQGHLEKQRMKSRLKLKLESERNKMVRGFFDELEHQEKQLKVQMYNNQLKALQDAFNIHPNVNFDVPASESDNYRPSARPITKNRGILKDENVNPRRLHRRSFSEGRIIDHRPDEIVEPSTVFKANMPNKKMVRRLRSGDLTDNKKVAHYCLTTTDKDLDGDLQTKLYEGDVLQTHGGGAQVVFNNLEILTQKDPLNTSLGKRDLDGNPKLPQAYQASSENPNSDFQSARARTFFGSPLKMSNHKRLRK